MIRAPGGGTFVLKKGTVVGKNDAATGIFEAVPLWNVIWLVFGLPVQIVDQDPPERRRSTNSVPADEVFTLLSALARRFTWGNLGVPDVSSEDESFNVQMACVLRRSDCPQ